MIVGNDLMIVIIILYQNRFGQQHWSNFENPLKIVEIELEAQ